MYDLQWLILFIFYVNLLSLAARAVLLLLSALTTQSRKLFCKSTSLLTACSATAATNIPHIACLAGICICFVGVKQQVSCCMDSIVFSYISLENSFSSALIYVCLPFGHDLVPAGCAPTARHQDVTASD